MVTFSIARIFCLKLAMDINNELQFLLSKTNEGKQLSEYHMTILNKRNISTGSDFLDAVNLHTHLALRAEQVELIKRELLLLFVKSSKLSTLYQKSPINYSTGIEVLDHFLDSIGQPLRPGQIWEIYSQSGIGTTELFYTLAVNFVFEQKNPQEVLYIDAKHDFNSERIEEILQNRQVDTETMRTCLNAIKVISVEESEELKLSLIEALEDFRERLSTADETVSNIKLVLIDTLAASFILFRTCYERNAGRSYLTRLAMLMRQLATQHGLCFVLGNLLMSQNDDSDDEDAGAIDDNEEVSSQTGSETQEDSNLLGEYWNSVCTLTLALELPEESQGSDGMRLLKVLNNSYGDSEGSCLLRITDEGVI